MLQQVQALSRSFSVIVADDRAFLIVVNSDQSAMVVDSHSHGNGGAIIACCLSGKVASVVIEAHFKPCYCLGKSR